MAVKKRVFQVAREFNISNEELIEYLLKLDFDIRNHMSLLNDEAYDQVITEFGEKPEKPNEEYEFRKRLRDRRALEEGRKEEARKDLERRLQASTELAKEMPKLKQQRKIEAEEKKKIEDKAAEKPEQPTAPEKAPAEKPKRPKKKLKVIEIPPEEGAVKAKAEKPEPEKAGKEKSPAETTEKATKKKRRKRRRKKDVPEEAEAPEKLAAEQKQKKRKKGKKKRKPSFDEKEIEDNIRQTLATMEDAGKGKRRKKRSVAEEEIEEEEIPVIKVSEFMSLSEIAKVMNIDGTELIRKCMDLGMMVTINQRLDMDTIELLASEYGYQVEALEEFGEELVDVEEEDAEEDLEPRSPVVTIMGHVDHGKTSLLDYIRKSNIISGESGGITQHIGAYEVDIDKEKSITFLDTPGHEAFTAMRARGAQATDIVVLVVAADDNVMPQTTEAISHAKAASVPMVIAINKVDKPNANPDLIRKQLADKDVLVEQWGGKYQSVEISAKTGQNVDSLLEAILLEAEMLNLRANPSRLAKGVIIESKLDKGKGPVATVLVQKGTLSVGDPFVSGACYGKVRSMFDERGRRVKSAIPAVPVQVLGFDGLPQAGDSFTVLESERDTKEVSQKRQQLQREYEHWRSRPRTLDEISQQIQKGQIKQLLVILKGDVDGSIQAITDSLMKLSGREVAVTIIHSGVGAISESDVLLAAASGAIIIGFNVRPTSKSRELAEKENVDIRQYEVIYDIVNDIKAALEGFLQPQITEELKGTIEVRQIFKVPKVGTVAGCYISSGLVNRNDPVKVYRDDRLIHDGQIVSLKRFKEDVKELNSGYECGVGLANFNDLRVNDIIEAYRKVETKRTLEDSNKGN